MIRTKRVYEDHSSDDGFRILVDHLWPRGVSKDEAKIDLWLKEISPSDKLRKWFSHDPKKWKDFHIKIQGGIEREKGFTSQDQRNRERKEDNHTPIFFQG